MLVREFAVRYFRSCGLLAVLPWGGRGLDVVFGRDVFLVVSLPCMEVRELVLSAFASFGTLVA